MEECFNEKTPLFETHCKLGGKIIDFGGWALPVQYTGVIKEHEQVRSAAGLFDVSHMGEITVRGSDAQMFLQNVLSNDILKTRKHQAVYSPMCYPDGGVVDDLLVYKFDTDDYLLVVNASNTQKDDEWLKKHAYGQIEIENVTNSYAQLAIQGPKAQQILQTLCDFDLHEIKFFCFKPDVRIGGIPAMVSRTGYTGEDGFEIYIASGDAPLLWDALLAAGGGYGLVPVGLGARDTLRLEAALPLYGQDISEHITPFEAGLGLFVRTEKQSFIGREALIAQEQKGLLRMRIGFEMIDPGIPRSHYEVFSDGKVIGFVTSGTFSPTLKKASGLPSCRANIRP